MAAGMEWQFILDSSSLTQENTREILILKFAQITYAIGLFVIPYFIYKWVSDNRYDYTVMKSSLNWKHTVLFAVTIVLAVPFINAMAAWNSGISLPGFLADLEYWVRSKEEVANALIELFLSMNTPGDFVFNLVLIAFIPAISEELFFRGMMQPLVVKSIKNIHVAIWTTAFLFSFLHLQFLGFLPRMVLGAVLGYAAHWSGSLIVPMAGHLANNALALTLSWLAQRNLISSRFDTIGSERDEIQWAIVSAISLFVCMWVIWRADQKQKTPREEGFIS